MKILSKLVIKEIVPPMLVSLVIILFVFLMRTIAELAKSLIISQYSLGEIAELLLYSIPPILGFVIPMSLLLGIILGLNRLSSDSEVIALLSGGISAHALTIPVILIAIIAWLSNTWLLTSVVPWSNENYERIVFEHSSSVINAEVKPRVFNENFPGFIIFVDDIEPDTGIWHKVFIFDKMDPENRKAIVANRGRLLQSTTTGSIDLQVSQFYSYTFPRSVQDQPTQVVMGGSTVFHLVEGKDLEARVNSEKKPQAKTVPELLGDIRNSENKILFRTVARNDGRRKRPVRFSFISGNAPPLSKTIEVPPTGTSDQSFEIEFDLPPGYEAHPLSLNIASGNQTVFQKELSVDQFADNRENFFIGQEIVASNNVSFLSNKIVRERTAPSWVEIHKKFAIPFTCIIFALLGMPLGLSSRRGGKAYGYITGILIFLAYWVLLSTGDRLATSEKLPALIGIWLPNVIFGVLAVILIIRRRLEIRLPVLSVFLLRVRTHTDYVSDTLFTGSGESGKYSALPAEADKPRPRMIGSRRRLLSLVDRYVLKTFLSMFSLVFVAMYAIFSLVQYIDQNYYIQKNNVDPSIIIDFFIYKAPDTIYWILPISTLMGTMICFGLLSKHQEVTAFKASGISIYRLSVPVVLAAVFLALLGFYNQDIIVPKTSTKLAEVMRVIRNGPVQTVTDPTNRWILAENKEAIYYFQKYDDIKREINELQIFSFNPATSLMKRSIYSQQAVWRNGKWLSDRGWSVIYRGVSSTRGIIKPGEPLPIRETPNYFGQEFRPADQMSFAELEAYIHNLRTYGLSTIAEEFQLNWKLAFPFLPVVMTILGLPFAFSSARKSGGALTGIFVSIGLVILYWGVMTMLKALGETGYLPALMAAWSPNIVFLGIGALLFSAVKS